MEVIHERCAGLDVHKETVVACLRVRERGQVTREVRRWATTTAQLLELGDWLRQAGCTHVAMEATGVYWKPVWHVLEGEFELILANPTEALGANRLARDNAITQLCAYVGLGNEQGKLTNSITANRDSLEIALNFYNAGRLQRSILPQDSLIRPKNCISEIAGLIKLPRRRPLMASTAQPSSLGRVLFTPRN